MRDPWSWDRRDHQPVRDHAADDGEPLPIGDALAEVFDDLEAVYERHREAGT